MSNVTQPRTAPPFDCPNCATSLAAGSGGCHACGIRLTGPLALRLWQVGQEIDVLTREQTSLRHRLLAPADADELRLTGSRTTPAAAQPGSLTQPGASLTPPGPAIPPVTTPPPSGGLSGQQLLLGVGALMLLSGAAFFLSVVWGRIGVGGQALVMLLLTGLAAAGAVAATRRRLPAAAETAAVIATVLVWLDLTAAHALGLLGLDRLDTATYWAGAGLVGAAVLAGFDAWLPRTVAGAPARRMFVYRPALTVLVCVGLWNLFVFAPDLSGTAAAAAALVLTLASAGVALAAYRLDPPEPGGFRPSIVAPVVSTAVALMTFLGQAVGAGYAPGAVGERYGAMALLLVLPLAAAGWALSGRLTGRWRDAAYVVAAAGSFVAAGVPVMQVPREALSVLALLLGVGAGALLLRPLVGFTVRTVGAVWCLTGVVALVWLVWLLELSRTRTGLDWWGMADGTTAATWVATLPMAGFALATGAAAWSRRSPVWTVPAQIAAVLAVWTLVRGENHEVVLVVALALAMLHGALAAMARWLHREGGELGFEVLGALGAVVHVAVALATATSFGTGVHAATWLVCGAGVLAYAVLPGRLPVAYLGVLLVPVGVGILLDAAGVGTVEAYTASAVLILAAIGAVQWRRTPGIATLVAMGPTLVVGVLPSLAVGIAGDEVVRLVLVTLVALALLVAGLVRKWLAPVLVGLGALGVVAVTQGGPLVEYVPNFVLLMGAGAIALAVGVAWESAVNAGRRGFVWLGSLR